MNRLRYFLLIVCLSPAILATSIDGYRQWAPNSFKERKSPAWLEKAKAPKGGPRNLMEKTLLSKGKEPPNPRLPFPFRLKGEQPTIAPKTANVPGRHPVLHF